MRRTERSIAIAGGVLRVQTGAPSRYPDRVVRGHRPRGRNELTPTHICELGRRQNVPRVPSAPAAGCCVGAVHVHLMDAHLVEEDDADVARC